MTLTDQTLEFASTVQTRFAKGDAKIKKELLSTIGLSLTLNDKILSIVARKPFFILGKSTFDDKPETEPIEPENIGLHMRTKGLLPPSFKHAGGLTRRSNIVP